MDLNQFLLVLHLLGLAMGLSVSFANMVMGGLITKASPAEQPVLGRFPPAMSRVGTIGLTLLWATGVTMVFTKWGGLGNLGNMPLVFHLKLGLVVVLTGVVMYVHSLERKMKPGDAAAARRIQSVAKIATLLAVVIVVLAVLSFD
jgi:hypothetical protein